MRRSPQGQTRRWPALLLVAILVGLQMLLGTPAIAQDGPSSCAAAPSLERPGEGAVGSMDPPQGNGLKDSLYLQYGYAGFVWHTYDQGVAPFCGDPFADFTTFISNRLFDASKLLVGTTNALHYILKGDFGLATLDGLVKEGTGAFYKGGALPYIGLVLALVALSILVYTVRGNLAGTAKAGGRVLFGLWLMTATAVTPLLYVGIIDSILVTGVQELEANIYKAATDGTDGATGSRHVLPTLLHNKIIVENWAIGEFGNYETQYAKDTVRRLIDAQAWTRDDLITGRDADNAAEQKKKEEFKKIAEEIRGGAANFESFNGDNSARLGAGFFSLIEALCMTLFQLVAKAAILLSQVLFRLGIIVGPVLGLLAMAPGVGRTIARMIGGIVVMGLVLTVGSVAHGFVMVWITESQAIPGRGVKLMLMIVVTIIFWAAMRPWRRLKDMAAAAVGLPAVSRDQRRLEDLLTKHNKGSLGSRLWGRLRRTGQAIDQMGYRSHEMSMAPPDRPEEPTRRPESASTTRHARVFDGELVPSAARGRRRYFDDIDGEFWETTPEPQRAELAASQMGRWSDTGDHSSGDAGRPDPGDGGQGGGGQGSAPRSESSPSRPVLQLPPGRGDDLPSVVQGDVVVPSELEERDRWLDAERTETRSAPDDVPPTVAEAEKSTFQVYRPSTGRREDSTDVTGKTGQRPEAGDRPSTTSDEGER